MTCEPHTFATASAEAYGPAPSLDGNPSTPLTTTRGAVAVCATKPPMAGGQACALNAPISPHGSRPLWMEAWIASQRASLVGILAQQARVRDSAGRARDQRMPDACEQSTLGDLLGSSWKTALASSPSDGMSSLATSWRVDTAGATESLPRLILASVEGTTATDGTASLAAQTLPTLTVCGNYNRVGASEKSGDGIATALRTLPTLMKSDGKPGAGWMHGDSPRIAMALKMPPTLCATDSKSPYSAAGYAKQTEKRSKPLRDTAAHTIGIRLTPAFCLWWMGWPVEALAATRGLGSRPLATRGCRSKPI